MSAVKILYGGRRQEDCWTLDKATTTNFYKGEFVNYTGGAAEHMDAVGEDATFAGVVGMDARNGEDKVLVLKRCQIEVDAVINSYAPGAPLEYEAGDSGTDYKVTNATSGQTLMWAAQEYPAGTTRLRANVDVGRLAKLEPLT